MIDKFLKELAELNASPATIKGYGHDLTRFSTWLYENKIHLDAVSINDIAEFRSQMLETLSPVTVNRILACLRSFFRFLYKYDYIKPDLAKKIDLIPVDTNKVPIVLSPQEQLRIVAAAEAGIAPDNKTRNTTSSFERLRNVCLIRILLSNLRVGETAKLSLEGVVITGRGRGESVALRVNGKGRRLRTVPLDADTKHSLLEYLDAREAYVQNKLPDETALFVGRNIHTVNGLKSIRLGIRGIQQIVTRLSSAAGVPNITPHRFRASHITDSLRSGDRIDLVAARCGNSIGVIQEHYNRIYPSDQQEAVDKVQSWRKKITQKS